jgi:hypothetical protein
MVAPGFSIAPPFAVAKSVRTDSWSFSIAANRNASILDNGASTHVEAILDDG